MRGREKIDEIRSVKRTQVESLGQPRLGRWAESEMSIYIIQGDPWRPVVDPVENVRASGATSTGGRASVRA